MFSLLVQPPLGRDSTSGVFRVRFGVVYGWEGDQTVQQVRAERFANCGLFAVEIQNVIHNLKRHADLISKVTHGLRSSPRLQG